MRILRGLSIMLLAVISSALLANEQVLVLSESEIELTSFSSEQTVSFCVPIVKVFKAYGRQNSRQKDAFDNELCGCKLLK